MIEISLADLKSLIHQEFSRTDKLLLVLASVEEPAQVRDIVSRASSAGLRIGRGWNVSNILSRSKGQAIRTPSGWEISDLGFQHLMSLGVSQVGFAATNVSRALREELSQTSHPDARAFMQEAISCYEAGLFRSAIVMSWLAAVYVMQRYVVANCLVAFNAEAKRVNVKWKDARTPDEIGRMRESEFLERICAISMIARNVKSELKACLDRRNGCGHPTSLKIGANTAAHHIEILLLNVFKQFSS